MKWISKINIKSISVLIKINSRRISLLFFIKPFPKRAIFDTIIIHKKEKVIVDGKDYFIS